MKHSWVKMVATICAFVLLCGIASADETKRILKPNRTLQYIQTPKTVDSFSKMFEEGMFYGRIRSNNFYWDWLGDELPNKKDNYAMGLGGSIVYKSAIYGGFSTEAAFYGSESPLHMSDEDVGRIKAGKDVTSRYDVTKTGKWGLYSLAVANIDYKYAKTDLRVGRLMFESVLTRSNDTKMIPNTFEGAVLSSKEFDKTKISLAYLTRQKLRDHSSFHDIITYGNYKEIGAPYNNDDSASHRKLTPSALKTHGKKTHNALVVAEMKNKSISNLTLTLNYTAVPSLISDAIVEGAYAITVGDWKVIPALRYIRQFDNGAGKVGGANILGSSLGYKNPDSLDTYLVAAKVDFKSKTTKFRLGYSYVADKADIVAPWRGFPTGGYTRAMGQYNWFANTKTYLARVDYDLGKAGIVSGLSVMFRYAYEDFDENKRTLFDDTNVYNFDMIHKLKSLQGFETRLRVAYVDIAHENDSDDLSYIDSRLEFNYLF